jgi:hypothetical protein
MMMRTSGGGRREADRKAQRPCKKATVLVKFSKHSLL